MGCRRSLDIFTSAALFYVCVVLDWSCGRSYYIGEGDILFVVNLVVVVVC